MAIPAIGCGIGGLDISDVVGMLKAITPTDLSVTMVIRPDEFTEELT